MKIGFGSDHGGYELKMKIMKALAKEDKYELFDFGSFEGEKADYPIYAKKTADAVANGDVDLGLLYCGTGIGISIAANKVKGIRCAHVSDPYSSRMAKEHNNANMLALGGRVLGEELALEIVHAFLNAEFQGGRHQNRLDLITKMEEN